MMQHQPSRYISYIHHSQVKQISIIILPYIILNLLKNSPLIINLYPILPSSYYLHVHANYINTYQFYSFSSMRRSHRSSFRPEKQFINTYHINEVPLPYYNPLEDPFLRGFFSNRKVQGYIEQQGLLYEPRQEYPYMNRRTKNAYKFHRDNSVGTPLSHQLHASEGTRSFMYSSQRDFREDDNMRSSSPLSPLSPQLKKRAQSEILNTNKIPSLSQILAKRPSTQNQRRRLMASSDGKARSRIFQNKSFSINRVEVRKNPEHD